MRREAPAGEDRGFCGPPVCRSDKPIRIVGGHNDAVDRMPLFYQDCNSYSTKLTTNCANSGRISPLDSSFGSEADWRRR
jgi:hypothetical protein